MVKPKSVGKLPLTSCHDSPASSLRMTSSLSSGQRLAVNRDNPVCHLDHAQAAAGLARNERHALLPGDDVIPLAQLVSQLGWGACGLAVSCDLNGEKKSDSTCRARHPVTRTYFITGRGGSSDPPFARRI
jgi:hypothetical protein